MPDLWPHQVEAIDRAMTLMPGGMGLFFRMRRGKTRTALEIAKRLGARRIVVFAPKSVVDENVWGKEAAACWPGSPPLLRLKGDGRAKAATITKHATSPALVVLNHETMWREPMATTLLGQQWDVAIVDEIHKAKSPKGKQSEFLGRLARLVPNRLGLTGTPRAHDELDLWGQFRFIEPDLFEPTFTRFRMHYSRLATFAEIRAKDADTYMWPGQAKVLQRWKFINAEALWAKVWEHATYVPDEELAIPPIDTSHELTLEPAAQRAYAEMARSMVAEIGAGVVTASNAGVKLLRLQQLSGGTLSVENLETGAVEPHVISRVKEQALQEQLELYGSEPVVVFCRFHSDIDASLRAAAAAGLTAAEHSGRVHALDVWQRGGAQVLVTQIQSGGVGIDLTRSCRGIYYSLGFSLTDYEQSRARFLGPRQLHPVSYDHLIAAPIDAYVYEALQDRADVVAAVVERLSAS